MPRTASDPHAAQACLASAAENADASLPCREDDARTPGALGRRAPRWWVECDTDDTELEPWLPNDEALERFLEWVEECGIEPWPHQEDALMNLAVGDHVILGTPTGSGKSLVAQGMCFLALCTGRQSYYTAPIKALVSEKFFSMVDTLGRDNVGMITGDSVINPNAPVICCTAEILANVALREGSAANVGCAVMDEFHFYSDPDRGWAWQVPLLAMPQTQFLLMSATLGDVSAIARSLSERTGTPVDIIDNAPRPVPLTFSYALTPIEATVELALRKGEAPLYLVHFSQAAASATAQALASYGVATKEQRAEIKEAIKKTRFSTAFGKTLHRLLECGVGIHHAGMLPRYRLLVEKLAQLGLLPVICGTDTLGVGINVPIHTVVLTELSKFDGSKLRRLRVREFHQIAGRAGRSGFDTEGVVIAQAPPHEIANAKLLAKAGNDPKQLRKVKKKKPPEGFVNWDEGTFTRLAQSAPEALKPRMRITHSMVLAVVSRGGDAYEHVHQLIESSAQTDEQKAQLHTRAGEIFSTLIEAGVITCTRSHDGSTSYSITVDLPENFALEQPLSPFLLAALDLLDPESDTYALDVVSLVEATLEDPRQVLHAQTRACRDKAMAEMKADGVDYDERMERLSEITYPRPLEDLLDAAFTHYCRAVPWASDFQLAPKSVLRDMVETVSDFNTYVGRYKIAHSEGTLLRYLADAYHVLARTLPLDARNEQLWDIISWLELIVRTTDSSLVSEWESAGAELEASAPPPHTDAVVADRRGLVVLVRNALFARVRLASANRVAELGKLDAEWDFGERRWREALKAYFDAHGSVAIDADARSQAFFVLDDTRESTEHVWQVHQIFSDPEADHDFGIKGEVDLDATQETGEVAFKRYAVGFIEELLDE